MTATASMGSMTQIVRLFALLNITILAAYILNVFLTFVLELPGPFSFSGGASYAQFFIYVLAVALPVVYLFRGAGQGLRQESAKISDFNAFLIRAAFWGVFFVGIADAIITFVIGEPTLSPYLGEELRKQMLRPQARGVSVHLPLLALGVVVANFTRTLGFTWLALLIVVAELAIVITRFVFSYEKAFMGDLVRFWYAGLFLFASAYTLLEEGHVRVDVFYAGFRSKVKGCMNAIGTLVFGLSFCWVILLIGTSQKSSIIIGPLLRFEISQGGAAGLYVKYLMAGFLGVFAITMIIQFASYLLDAWADYLGLPGKREPETESTH